MLKIFNKFIPNPELNINLIYEFVIRQARLGLINLTELRPTSTWTCWGKEGKKICCAVLEQLLFIPPGLDTTLSKFYIEVIILAPLHPLHAL